MAARSFAPFRHRTFALFWCGSVVSNIGTIMEAVALGYYVQVHTGRATWNGIVAALGFLPTAVMAPVGGALADRLDRRHLLLASTMGATTLAALMTFVVASNRGAPATIAAIAFLAGSVNALGWPAFQSLLPELVPPEDLVAAVGLSAAQWNLARVIGPVVAGLVISFGSVSWALGINTVSFFSVLAVLLVIRFPARPPTINPAPIAAAIRAGWTYLRGEPSLWTAFRIQWLNCFLASGYIGLVPAVARKVFHGDKGLTAAMSSAMGVGAVLATLGFGSLAGRVGVRRVLLGATLGLPVATVVYAAAPRPWLGMIGLAALAFCYLSSLSSTTAIAQTTAPAALRGRVLASNAMGLGLLYPVAVFSQGVLGDAIGLRWAMTTFAAILAAVLLAVALFKPAFVRPLRHLGPSATSAAESERRYA